MTVRRQANIKGGRTHEHRVLVSGEQERQLRIKATELGVTIPKLLVDTALGAPVVPQRAVLAELAGMRRQLTEVRTILSRDPALADRDRQLGALFQAWTEQ